LAVTVSKESSPAPTKTRISQVNAAQTEAELAGLHGNMLAGRETV
jgi:hypothetical protein